MEISIPIEISLEWSTCDDNKKNKKEKQQKQDADIELITSKVTQQQIEDARKRYFERLTKK